MLGMRRLCVFRLGISTACACHVQMCSLLACCSNSVNVMLLKIG